MAESFPPELSGLLDSRDAASREEAWQRFVNRHSRLLLTTARETCADYDDGMERYTFLLDELKRDDCQRLRKYLADGRGKFTTWLVVVARRLCVDHHRKKYGRRRGVADVRADAEWEMRSRLIRMISEQVEVTTTISGSTLFVGSDDGSMYALQTDDPIGGLANSPWPKLRADEANSGVARLIN